MDEEEEKKKFETEENDGKGKKKRLNIEALCERLILKRFTDFFVLGLRTSVSSESGFGAVCVRPAII